MLCAKWIILPELPAQQSKITTQQEKMTAQIGIKKIEYKNNEGKTTIFNALYYGYFDSLTDVYVKPVQMSN